MLQQHENNPNNILYVGRKARRDLAETILRSNGSFGEHNKVTMISSQTTLISEMPIPGAIRVPCYLRTYIPLSQPLSELTARYDKKLRQLLRKSRQNYHTQQALDDATIDQADQGMLQPYARARHGDNVAQLQREEVLKMAKNIGRLDILYLNDEAVGCHLGFPYILDGKRYWAGHRVGFPEVVFSDPKRLHEINSINNYIALELAIENDFDFYDNGTCLARPDDGLLQWKKHRGGAVSARGNHNYFYVRLPKVGAAQFLWDCPLFAVEGNNLAIHFGLPDGPSDDDVATHYREMRFSGLFKIYLHCARTPGDLLLEKLRDLYIHEKTQLIVVSAPAV